jgi:hypothetical protein
MEAVLETVAEHKHVEIAALSPLFVNIFIPSSAAVGLVFAIWCVPCTCLLTTCIRGAGGRIAGRRPRFRTLIFWIRTPKHFASSPMPHAPARTQCHPNPSATWSQLGLDMHVGGSKRAPCLEPCQWLCRSLSRASCLPSVGRPAQAVDPGVKDQGLAVGAAGALGEWPRVPAGGGVPGRGRGEPPPLTHVST